MNRCLLPVLLIGYCLLGVHLLVEMKGQPIPPGWKIQAGKGQMKWSEKDQQLMVFTQSKRLILETADPDLDKIHFVNRGSESLVIINVTGDQPSRISGPLELGGELRVINPHGIIVGTGATFP